MIADKENGADEDANHDKGDYLAKRRGSNAPNVKQLVFLKPLLRLLVVCLVLFSERTTTLFEGFLVLLELHSRSVRFVAVNARYRHFQRRFLNKIKPGCRCLRQAHLWSGICG